MIKYTIIMTSATTTREDPYGYRYSAPDRTRSCHDNKSQRADPFVVLSRIIAGKTKCVKDPFSPRIHTISHFSIGLSVTSS